jgi:hypothetical protein
MPCDIQAFQLIYTKYTNTGVYFLYLEITKTIKVLYRKLVKTHDHVHFSLLGVQKVFDLIHYKLRERCITYFTKPVCSY